MAKTKIILGSALALSALPATLAASNIVSESLTNFVYGTKGLLHGNAGAFMNGVVGLLPLVALVLIVFGLMLFLSRITIFKHPDHEKYAKMVAAGIAIIGLVQQNVFATILGWSTTFLIFAFITALIFMGVMFINHNRKEHLPLLTDVQNAKALSLKAKRDLKKLKHELGLDEKLYRRLETDLDKLNTSLNKSESLMGSELSQVKEIIEMLSKVASAQKSGNNGLVHEYAQALANKVGALITSMKHEDKVDTAINTLTAKIESVLDAWTKSDKGELYDEHHLEKLITQVAKILGHDGIEDKHVQKLVYENHESIKHIHEVKRLLSELHALQNHLTKEVEHIDKYGYKQKHLEASQARSAIFNQQFDTAHKHMDNLLSIVHQEPGLIARVKQLSGKIQMVLHQLEEQETIVKKLLKKEFVDLSKTIGDEKAVAKSLAKLYVSYAQQAQRKLSSLEASYTTLYHLVHAKGAESYFGFIPSLGNALHHWLEKLSELEGEKKSPQQELEDIHSHLDSYVKQAQHSTLSLPAGLSSRKGKTTSSADLKHQLDHVVKQLRGARRTIATLKNSLPKEEKKIKT